MSRKRFRREKKFFDLTFETDDLAGFECRMAGVSLERFIEITKLANALQTPEGRTPENVERQFTIVGELLVDWNLDDDNGEVPCDYEHLKKEDFGFVQQIMAGYMQAMAGVPKASEDDSSSGGTSEQLSLGLGSASSAQGS